MPQLSSTSLLNKLQPFRNEFVCQKISILTKPISNQIRLTKLFPFRKRNHQTSTNAIHHKQPRASPNLVDPNIAIANQSASILQQTSDINEQSALAKSISEDSSQQKSTSASNTTGSISSPSASSTTATTYNSRGVSSADGIAIVKRRSDNKSQSVSLDDTLSTIEEKLDDEEHQSSSLKPPGQANELQLRQRLLSSSSSRGRPMLRTKEIELSDQELDAENPHLTGISISSSVKGEDSDIDQTLSTSISEDRQMTATGTIKRTKSESQSILSSSSPSSSLLTDETVKHATGLTSNKQTSPPPFTTQLSAPVMQKPHPVLRRSETDLANDKPMDQAAQVVEASLNRSESSYTNTSSSNPITTMLQHQTELAKQRASPISLQQQQSKVHPGGFVQSVRAIKAQQQLLQNMIKHQNQNLLSSSSIRARNAFMYPNRVYQSEYPFVTLKRYPDDMIQCTGGVVSVHSVKLLDHIINDEESETRDIWWTEIRKEIRSHAKALNCNTILGYSETSKVLGDVCVLSACGTAAIMKPSGQLSDIENEPQHYKEFPTNATTVPLHTLRVPLQSHSPLPSQSSMQPSNSLNQEDHHDNFRSNSRSIEEETLAGEEGSGGAAATAAVAGRSKLASGSAGAGEKIDCSFCHTPLLCADSISSLANCSICQSAKVPDVMLLTIEPPQKLNIVSGATLVQARVCRAKRDSHGEASAKEIGDALPFLEYELHRQLFTKLKFKGMNCLFNLNVDISAGENMLTGIATGTGCFVLGLPVPDPPQISAGKGIKTSRLNEIQRLISLTSMKNRESLGLYHIESQLALYRERLNSISSCHQHQIANSSIQTAGSLDDQIESAHADQDTRNSTETSPNNLDQVSSDTKSADNNNRLAVRPKLNAISQNFPSKRHHNRQHHNRHHHHNNHHHHHHHHHHHNHSHHNQFSRAEVQNEFDTNGTGENLLDLLADNNNIVLEVDDNEDADIITQLIDSDIPEGYLICNSESIPTLSQSSITSINMFTQVMRVKLTGMDQFAQQFDWILQALFVKLRRSLPCCLSNVSFVVDLPEAHVVQISVTGCLMGLRSSPKQLLAEAFGPKNADQAREDKAGAQVVSSSLTSLISSQSSTEATRSSSSSSSSISSASPSSSSSTNKSTVKTSKSSSSIQSQADTDKLPPGKTGGADQQLTSAVAITSTATCGSDTNARAHSELKSLTKQFSKSNLASLLSNSFDRKKGGSQKKASNSENAPTKAGDVELVEVDRSARATMNAVKHEMQQARLATTQQPFLTVRAVFKKQQTYPGANSPLISGHDNLLAANLRDSNSTMSNTGGGGRSASRRATIILNKVKQPLRGLGSNFNTTLNLGHTNSDHPATTSGPTAATATTNGTSSSATDVAAGQTIGTTTSGRNTPTSSSRAARSSLFAQKNSQTSSQIPFDSIEHKRQDQTTSMQMSSARAAINSSIDITSLSYIPGAKDYHYLGNLSFSFVRETNSVRENGGLNGFIHCFLMEVYAIVRAHVSALGGNAFLSFRLQQSCILYHSNKNQAQCLISVAGDAAQVSL